MTLNICRTGNDRKRQNSTLTRDPSRFSSLLRVEDLDQQRLLRCHITTVIPLVLRLGNDMPLLVVHNALAKHDPGSHRSQVAFINAPSIAHRKRLSLDWSQRLPHVDDTPARLGLWPEQLNCWQSVEHDLRTIV